MRHYDGMRRSERILPWREDSPVEKQTKTRGCGAEDFVALLSSVHLILAVLREWHMPALRCSLAIPASICWQQDQQRQASRLLRLEDGCSGLTLFRPGRRLLGRRHPLPVRVALGREGLLSKTNVESLGCGFFGPVSP